MQATSSGALPFDRDARIVSGTTIGDLFDVVGAGPDPVAGVVIDRQEFSGFAEGFFPLGQWRILIVAVSASSLSSAGSKQIMAVVAVTWNAAESTPVVFDQSIQVRPYFEIVTSSPLVPVLQSVQVIAAAGAAAIKKTARRMERQNRMS